MTPAEYCRDEWANELVGIPYELHGETPAGADCWGLCRLFARLAGGPVLPDLRERFAVGIPSERDPRIARGICEAARDEDIWAEVELADREPFDVLEFDEGDGVGIVVDRRTLLTTSRELGSSIRPRIGGLAWSGRISGVFRIRDRSR